MRDRGVMVTQRAFNPSVPSSNLGGPTRIYGQVSRIGIAAAVLKTEGSRKRVCEFESHLVHQFVGELTEWQCAGLLNHDH